MVKVGSPIKFANYLAASDRILHSLEKTALGLRFSTELRRAASEMRLALKAGDFDMLLAMEKLAAQRDFREYGPELAQKSENGHRQIMERWRIVSNPAMAREDFYAAYAPENISKARAIDPIMESLVKTQCRRLADYAKGNATPAEKFYFSCRQECLRAIYKEHILRLSHALGLNKGHEKSRGLSR